jgi:hypothetical protein
MECGTAALIEARKERKFVLIKSRFPPHYAASWPIGIHRNKTWAVDRRSSVTPLSFGRQEVPGRPMGHHYPISPGILCYTTTPPLAACRAEAESHSVVQNSESPQWMPRAGRSICRWLPYSRPLASCYQGGSQTANEIQCANIRYIATQTGYTNNATQT